MPQGIFPKGNKGLFKKGITPWNKGKHKEYKLWPFGRVFSKETRFKMSLVKKGLPPSNKGKIKNIYCKICGKEYKNNRLKYCSEKCKQKDHVWNKGKLFEAIKGEKNPNWHGGVSKKNALERKKLEYDIWRKNVYKRDLYQCKKCGKKCKNNEIVAHHIKSFSKYPELRYDINNGITLCRICHIRIHKPALKLCRI